MYKRLIIIFAFLFCCGLQLTAQTQKSKYIRIIQAGSLSFDRERGNAQVLRGNVICEHEGTLLHCDTALVYDKENRMIASGSVLITKGDSLRITAQKLVYEGKTRLATLYQNVRCTDRDMVLTTDLLMYDTRTSVANYYNWATIVSKENTLVSKNGHYYAGKKEAAFNYSVVLTSPDYKMVSDTLRYQFASKTAFFYGPSTITSNNELIYCENGWYDTQRNLAQFSKNARLQTKDKQILKGDSMVYDRAVGLGRAFKRVTLVDSAQKSILYGNYIEYRRQQSEALATGKPLYSTLVNNDSLFLNADTLYYRNLDSVNNFLSAYHHVVIYKHDLQAIADSATLNTKDSLMKLYKNPILWSGRMQAVSKEIEVDIGKNSVKGFRLTGKAFLAQQVDSLHPNRFHQLTGKLITGTLYRDTLRKVTVSGNAEMLYYPKSKNSLVGLNHTVCSEIQMSFTKGQVSRVVLKPQTTGNVDPLKSVLPENTKLKGFQWLEHKRPLNRRGELAKPRKAKGR